MNDARVDHIEEALAGLDLKVDRKAAELAVQLEASTARLDGRIDALAEEMKSGFENAFRETQGGFDDHRAFSEFLVNGLRDEMNRRFNHVDRRFDNMDDRFDRLEALIKKS